MLDVLIQPRYHDIVNVTKGGRQGFHMEITLHDQEKLTNVCKWRNHMEQTDPVK